MILSRRSTAKVRTRGACTVVSGRWRSQYDGRTVRRASRVAVDRRVPLREAWRSGARRWNRATRRAFANDTGYAETLVVVTKRAQRAKHGRDVTRWRPRHATCAYTARYVAVKYRWRLGVDPGERRVIGRVLARCPSSATSVSRPARARIRPLPNQRSRVPRPGGRPRASNTGVPAGTKLTVHDGDLTISRAGTVIDGLDVRGDISVKADNVTIRNTIVRGRPVDTIKKSLISAYGDHKNLLIEDTTLRAAYPHPNRDGLKGRNFTARRINVSNVVDAVLVFGDNVRLEDSWLHDNTHFDPDWISTDGKSHDDSLQIQGGNNITIRHNVLEGAFHTGIMITQDRYRSTNITIAGNWLSGGSCTLNIAEKARGPITGLTIRDNRFGTSRITNCPIIAPPTTTQIATITNNLWDTTNTPITIRRGS